jgi:ribosomal protein L37AE/L43A
VECGAALARVDAAMHCLHGSSGTLTAALPALTVVHWFPRGASRAGAPSAGSGSSRYAVQPMVTSSADHVCPECASGEIDRVPRTSIRDYVVTLAGLRVYRCRECGREFYDRPS